MGATTDDFVSSFVLNLVIGSCLIFCFCTCRPWFKYFFQARAYRKAFFPDELQDGSSVPPRLGPSLTGWIKPLILIPDKEIIKTSGLDALVLIRFMRMSAILFISLSVYGLIVLLPINGIGVDQADGVTGIQVYGAGNVAVGSDRFWAHVISQYLVTCITCAILYYEFRYIRELRYEYLREQIRLGKGMSVLVEDIPEDMRSEAALSDFFRKLYPDTFLCSMIGRDYSELEKLVEERDAVANSLASAYFLELEDLCIRPTHIKVDVNPLDPLKMHFQEVDSIHYYNERLRELNEKVMGLTLLGPTHPSFESLPSGIVTFLSPNTASICASSTHSSKPFTLTTSLAPEPEDMIWENAKHPTPIKHVRYVIETVGIGFCVIFFFVPITFIATFSDLTSLSNELPWLASIVNSNLAIKTFLQGFLPGLGMIIFLALLPIFLFYSSYAQGINSRSLIHIAVFKKFFLFIIVDFFIIQILSTAVISNVSVLVHDPGSIFTALGNQLPTVSITYVNYIMLESLTVFPIFLLRIGPFIVSLILRAIARTDKDKNDAGKCPPNLYGTWYPNNLLIFLIGISFASIAPLVLPFSCIYFAVGYLVYKYHVVYVTKKEFESGGLFWPPLFSRIMVCLLTSQIFLIIFLSLKEAPAEAALVVVPAVGCCAFWIYMRKFYTQTFFSLPIVEGFATAAEHTRATSADGIQLTDEEYGLTKTGKDGAHADSIFTHLNPYHPKFFRRGPVTVEDVYLPKKMLIRQTIKQGADNLTQIQRVQKEAAEAALAIEAELEDEKNRREEAERRRMEAQKQTKIIQSGASETFSFELASLPEDALHCAVMDKDNNALIKALHVYDANKKIEGITALFWAVKSGNFEAVKILLDHGADFNVVDSEGNTPLHIACYHGLYTIGQKCVKMGANPLLQNASGYDAMWISVYGALNNNDSNQDQELSLGSGSSNPNSNGNSVTSTPLKEMKDRRASGRSLRNTGPFEIAKLRNLIHFFTTHSSTNINSRNRAGLTLLQWACTFNTPTTAAVVDMILALGGNVDERSPDGRQALHFAAASGCNGVIDFLCARGANPNSRIMDTYDTPLHCTSNPTIALQLIMHGARMDLLNFKEQKPSIWTAVEEQELQKQEEAKRISNAQKDQLSLSVRIHELTTLNSNSSYTNNNSLLSVGGGYKLELELVKEAVDMWPKLPLIEFIGEPESLSIANMDLLDVNKKNAILSCNLCSLPFGVTRWRNECTRCHRIICSKCERRKIILVKQEKKEVCLCDICINVLEANPHLRR